MCYNVEVFYIILKLFMSFFENNKGFMDEVVRIFGFIICFYKFNIYR